MEPKIESSKGWEVTFIGCDEERDEDKGYALSDQNHNEKDGLDTNIFEYQEFSVYDFEVDIKDNGVVKQTSGNKIKDLDKVIAGIKENRANRIEERIKKDRKAKQEQSEK